MLGLQCVRSSVGILAALSLWMLGWLVFPLIKWMWKIYYFWLFTSGSRKIYYFWLFISGNNIDIFSSNLCLHVLLPTLDKREKCGGSSLSCLTGFHVISRSLRDGLKCQWSLSCLCTMKSLIEVPGEAETSSKWGENFEMNLHILQRAVKNFTRNLFHYIFREQIQEILKV